MTEEWKGHDKKIDHSESNKETNDAWEREESLADLNEEEYDQPNFIIENQEKYDLDHPEEVDVVKKTYETSQTVEIQDDNDITAQEQNYEQDQYDKGPYVQEVQEQGVYVQDEQEQGVYVQDKQEQGVYAQDEQGAYDQSKHEQEVQNLEVQNQSADERELYDQGIQNQSADERNLYDQGIQGQGAHEQEVQNQDIYGQGAHEQEAYSTGPYDQSGANHEQTNQYNMQGSSMNGDGQAHNYYANPNYNNPDNHDSSNQNQQNGQGKEVSYSYYEPYKISQPIQPKLTPKQAKKRKKGSRKFLLRTSLLILSAVLFGVISSVVFQFTSSRGLFYSSNEPETNLEPMSQKESQDTSTADTTLVQTGSATVVKNSMPSIVAITNKSVQETRGLFGAPQSYETVSSGSGIIIGQNDKELFIVSNNHVVENAETLSVCFYSETGDGDSLDNEAVVEATIQGTDPRNDLAVIAVKIKDIPKDTLEVIKVAVLGNSEVLEVGQPVVAIGNALGFGQSVTQGIISALDREVTVDAFSNKLIQTDAAINFGNSGGALLNMNGEVIGINVIKLAAEAVEGMGYAIPISMAQPIIDDLMNRNSSDRVEEKGYLGISGVSVTEDISMTYDLPVGLFINQVEEGSPADQAGLKKGDVLVTFDGKEIDSMETLQSIISYYKASEEVEVTLLVYENNEYIEQSVTVVLDKRPN